MVEGEIASAATSVSFHGFISDDHDAILLVNAARLGRIPRFRRRLDITEQRDLIRSGSIFLWNEEESYMKRWTDGYPWSPSRIQNKFLVYREMAQRGCARKRTAARASQNLATSNEEAMVVTPSDDRLRKLLRSLTGSLFNDGELEELQQWSTSGKPRMTDIFKRGGLIKKTFTVAIIPNETWHLVAYYTLEDILAAKYIMPKEDAFLRSLPVCDVIGGIGEEPEERKVFQHAPPFHAHAHAPPATSVYGAPAPAQAQAPPADIHSFSRPDYHQETAIYPVDQYGHQEKYYYSNTNAASSSSYSNDSSLSAYSLPPSPLSWTSVSYDSADPHHVSSFTPYAYITVGSD